MKPPNIPVRIASDILKMKSQSILQMKKQLTFPIGVVSAERRQLSVKLLLTKYLREMISLLVGLCFQREDYLIRGR